MSGGDGLPEAHGETLPADAGRGAGEVGPAGTRPGGHGPHEAAIAATAVPVIDRAMATSADALPGDGQAATLPGVGVAADLPGLPRIDAACYAIGAELARGGMGMILAARDRRLRRDVVIKVTRQDAGRIDPRFEREALITARLQHPSIVRVYEAGVLGDGRAFYAMERVRGRSLELVLGATTNVRDRLGLLPHAIAVADALAYAHSEGVLHRDLKPANVLIGPFGETVVIDWGLAKDVRAAELAASLPSAGAPAADASLTQHGSVMGTPSYMAPEQARGEVSDERTDVYAIGALLYTMLTGVPPHRGATTEEVIARVSSGAPTPIGEREPSLPPELVTIVEHAMGHVPADRYATAKELADELRRFAAGKLVASHQYALSTLFRRWVWKHRAVIAVGGLAVVVLAVVAVLAARRIVDERDRANEEHVGAEIARAKAESALDHRLLDEAKAAVGVDPNRSAAAMMELSDAALGWPQTLALANEVATRGLAVELIGHTGDVELVEVAPDGRHVATAGDDSTIRWWRLDDGQVTVLRGHVGPVEAITISPDGKYLASAGTDHDVWLWELATGTGRKLAGHRSTVRGVAFSPDSTRLASTGEEGTLFVWDVASGTGRQLLQYHHGLRPVIWSIDGAAIIAGGYDGAIGRFDPVTGAGKMVVAHAAELRVLAASPDGKYLAAGDEDGVAALWTVDGVRVRTLGTHTDVVRDLVMTPDGLHVVSAGGDSIVRVDTLPTGPTLELTGNTDGVKDIAVSPDGAWVASAGIDGTVQVWPMRGGPARVFRGHQAAVKHVAFTRDGRLISGAEDDRARIWRLDGDGTPPSGPALRGWLAAQLRLSP